MRIVVGSCKVDMADNDTFRYLGGLTCTNLFSVHVRMGVYDLYYLEPVLVHSRPSWTHGMAFLRIFEVHKRDLQNLQKTLRKIMVLAI